jgi:hypothetical protein
MTVTGLAPGTVYHYRLVATNASGTAYSADPTLRTGAPAAGRSKRRATLSRVGAPRTGRNAISITLACAG